MVLGSVTMIMGDTMRAVGAVTKEKAKVMKNLVMETCTRVSTIREKSVAKVFTHGLMAISTMVIGWTDRNTATECGRTKRAISTWVSGKQIWRTASGSTSGKTVTSTKANGATVCDTGKALTLLLTEISFLGSMFMDLHKVSVSTDGRTEIPTRATLRMVKNMARAFGGNLISIAINMKAST